jgi:hypothetical protein
MSGVIAYSRVPKSNMRIHHTSSDSEKLFMFVDYEGLKELSDKKRYTFNLTEKFVTKAGTVIPKGCEVVILCSNIDKIQSAIATIEMIKRKHEERVENQQQKSDKKA